MRRPGASQCVNNLMQLAIAMVNYEASYEVLPPGVVNPTGPIIDQPKGYHFGWLVQILPYCELRNVYNHFNFKVGLYEAHNITTRADVIATFVCPSDNGPKRGAGGAAESNYVGCHHDVEAPIAATNKGVLFLNSAVRFEDIPDGTSQTILLSEKLNDGLDQGWASGTRASLRNTGGGINGLPIKTPRGAVPASPDDTAADYRRRCRGDCRRRHAQVRGGLRQPASGGMQHCLRRRLGAFPQELDQPQGLETARQPRRRRVRQRRYLLEGESFNASSWLHAHRAHDRDRA